MKIAFIITAGVFLPSIVHADDLPPCPPPYTLCLTEDQREKIVEAVKELDDIKSSPAKIDVKEPIVIVRDWNGRIYINGGEKKPIPLHLTIGKIIDRDLEMTLPIRVYERPEPEDPLFRARFRFQIGLMIPEVIQSIRDGELDEFWYGGLDLDFFHFDIFNVNLHVGSQGVGGGVGLDITKNMGTTVGAIVQWADWTPGFITGIYFAL